ncbi:MAG: hypothetical protein KF768_14670, partial [Phycisphaeraceae bacterium]|nr:hypothetical protein [Phycisphaeraceae bacterium]
SYVLNDPMNLVDPSGFTPSRGDSCSICVFDDPDRVVGTRSAAPSHIDTEVPQRPIDVDTAVHFTATQVGNLMDRHSPHLNPDLPFVVNRASSNPTGVVLEFAAAHAVRGAVEDLGTFADRDASAGDRAIAGVSTLLAVVPPGRAVGMARGAAGMVNRLTPRARAIGALVNSRFAASGLPALARRVRALRDFGLDQGARRAFLNGETVAFQQASGIIGFARMEGSRLVAGIFSINAPGQGVRLMSKFRSQAAALGRSLGATELQLAGAEFTNSALRATLSRAGFTAGTMEAPAALGGGAMNILSKVIGL